MSLALPLMSPLPILVSVAILVRLKSYLIAISKMDELNNLKHSEMKLDKSCVMRVSEDLCKNHSTHTGDRKQTLCENFVR